MYEVSSMIMDLNEYRRFSYYLYLFLIFFIPFLWLLKRNVLNSERQVVDYFHIHIHKE